MSEKPAKSPEQTRRSRSAAMVVLGIALFVMAGMVMATNPDGGQTGAILFGILGAGLIVGGLVIRR